MPFKLYIHLVVIVEAQAPAWWLQAVRLRLQAGAWQVSLLERLAGQVEGFTKKRIPQPVFHVKSEMGLLQSTSPSLAAHQHWENMAL